MGVFESNSSMFSIIKGILISFLFTIITLLIFSALLVYTNLSEETIKPVIITITGVSILVRKFYWNKKIKKKWIDKWSDNWNNIYFSYLCNFKFTKFKLFHKPNVDYNDCNRGNSRNNRTE